MVEVILIVGLILVAFYAYRTRQELIKLHDSFNENVTLYNQAIKDDRERIKDLEALKSRATKGSKNS